MGHLCLELLNHVYLIVVRLVSARIRLEIVRVVALEGLYLHDILAYFLDFLHQIWSLFSEEVDMRLVKMLENNFLAVPVSELSSNGFKGTPARVQSGFGECSGP